MLLHLPEDIEMAQDRFRAVFLVLRAVFRFFVVRFLVAFLVPFLAPFFAALRPVAFFGTFFPARRASDSPIAMACFRLFTFLPLRPLRNVPALRFFMARSTFLAELFEYRRAIMFCSSMDLSKVRTTLHGSRSCHQGA